MALFAHVVQARSFTGAAREVGIAKSAVSKRIALLEERLGVRLLNRSTRKLSVTGDGMRYYEHCAALLSAAAAADAALSDASQVAKGSLRVNAPVTLSQLHLGRAISQFLRSYPEIDVHLHAEDALVDVVEGGFDVVIRIARLGESSLVARKLASDRLVVCASPDYLARAGTPDSPADLVHHNCLHYARVPTAAEWRFRGPQGTFVVPARCNFSTTNGTVLREAALAGLGLAVLPSFMVAEEVAAGRLALVLEGARKAEIGVYAMFAERRQLPARTKLFLQFLAQYFGGRPLGLASSRSDRSRRTPT
ncbi:MAG: LysR family transcriptional regulator [Myxococcales bacterium]